MDPRLQRRIQRYGWDKAAAVYERCWSEQLAPAQRRLLEMAGPRAGERVLDVACGTGLVTFPAAAAVGPSGSVLAVDLSDSMVDHVNAEAARRGLSQVAARRMDAEALQLPDRSFNATVCALGLMYVPDPGGALKEMVRVLAPEGRAVAAVWGARDRCGWAPIFPIVDRRVESEVCPLFFHLGTGERLRRLMEDAGLLGVESVRLSVTLHYSSAEEACAAAFAGGPVALAHSRFDDVTRKEAYAEFLAAIEEWRVATRYEIPGEFVVAAGRRPPCSGLPRKETPSSYQRSMS